ncbi:hypothetical protein [Rhodococcus sp. 4CII]|uniref:hypothetical protein n=2 Tax=unclassified Rhodococcus (in: high G+C Gram-positive bacteria) TaxID=192944 RepID=UPI00163B1E73|nr:hypothetical protein [Rhodococcus sp. 4CII]MBC2640768.1 hypothetical protein [Rhodococcus sp. 3A]MBC2894486.1 hypothetical protein [Rhodococcus sp. 4CII]
MATIPPPPRPEAVLALQRALAARRARDECAGILTAWERSGSTADHDELLERATRDLDQTATEAPPGGLGTPGVLADAIHRLRCEYSRPCS